MRRNIQIFFATFLAIFFAFLSHKLRFELMPRAHSQVESAKQELPPPTDMPLPPENDAAGAPKVNSPPPPPPMPKAGTLPPSTTKGGVPLPQPPTKVGTTPAPPVPQKGLPVDIKGAAMTPVSPLPEETLRSSTPTPQDIDPSVKFISSQEFVYDPIGRRDPFKSYFYVSKKSSTASMTGSSPVRSSIPTLLQAPDQGVVENLESFELAQFSVAAILWDVKDPKAMLESPTKKMFMVHKHTKVGKNSGYVASIREGEIVVVEVAPDGKTPTTRVMVLQH